MIIKILALFTIGFGFGFLLSIYLFEIEIDEKISFQRFNSDITAKIRHEEKIYTTKTSEATAETTVADVKKIRILCFLTTRPMSHGPRASHILETWGKHCDKILFASTATDVNLGAIGFNVTDDHGSVWGKVKLMLKFIHQNYIDEYDWFMKGDDDTFVIVENLRFLLSAYSPDEPIYFGHKFNTTDHKRGYFSGGSGYVMSRKTVRTFVEKVLTNPIFFHKDAAERNPCHVETDAQNEDWSMALCLDNYDIYAGDSRDLLKRDRFFPFWPQGHLFGTPDLSNWYWQRKYYFNDEGLDACSNYSISYHYISSQKQYELYFLTYRLQTYGIKRRYPPPPKKKNFSEVIRILDEERNNKTLRGWL